MIIVTTPTISGYKINESLGLVRGSTTRARFIGRDIVAGLRMIARGEVKEYTKRLMESREQALQRMIADAKRLGGQRVPLQAAAYPGTALHYSMRRVTPVPQSLHSAVPFLLNPDGVGFPLSCSNF